LWNRRRYAILAAADCQCVAHNRLAYLFELMVSTLRGRRGYPLEVRPHFQANSTGEKDLARIFHWLEIRSSAIKSARLPKRRHSRLREFALRMRNAGLTVQGASEEFNGNGPRQ
jgi:hypothetical protein